MRTDLQYTCGSLLGLAVGDSLGMPCEGLPRGSFPKTTGLANGGPHQARIGEWTDDTSLACCLAESLVRHGGWNPHDAADRFRQWLSAGYWSSRERAFGIGRTTERAIERFCQTGDPYAGIEDPNTSGNGSLMRLAPVPLFLYRDPRVLDRAEDSSRLTHGSLICRHACRLMAAILVDLIKGLEKATILHPDNLMIAAPRDGFCPEIAAIAAGSFLDKGIDEIETTGYVVHTLEATLWCWYRCPDYRKAVCLAVDLGGDTDTTAAVVGQIAGLEQGIDAIPRAWQEALVYRQAITRLSEQLWEARPG
ncbi:MAG: ADP-ribosylglycohydrolase family protein [Opitutales bacterium]